MRGFSDDERDEIEEALVDTARELFTRYGFQKTAIQDITEPVGIAEGTFYRFFDSKSGLYTEILIRENETLIDTVETELESIDDPAARLERFVRGWAAAFEERPLLVETHRSPRQLLHHVDQEAFEDGTRRIMDRLIPLVEDLQENNDGMIAELEPRLVLDIMSIIEVTIALRESYETPGGSDYVAFQDAFQTILVNGLLSDRT